MNDRIEQCKKDIEALKKVLKDLEDSAQTYHVGELLDAGWNDPRCVGMITSPSYGKIQLTLVGDYATGEQWTAKTTDCKNPRKITQEEFDKISGLCKWVKRKNPLTIPAS